MDNFNQAENYDQTSSIQKEDGLQLLFHLSPRKGMKVLDLGCGTGYLSNALSEEVGPSGKVIAIDPDIERLQIARTKYSASNIEYRVGGAESIPMGDYDIIYSSNVLHWCKDKDLVFKQISKTLKIGGQLGIIVTGTKDYNIGEILFQPTDLLLDPAHRQHMMDQIHPFSPRLITNLATSHGFEIMYLNEHWQKWKFEDIQKLIKFYLTNWKYQGVFAENDFDLGAIEKHFRGREIVVNIPYITAVAKKMK